MKMTEKEISSCFFYMAKRKRLRYNEAIAVDFTGERGALMRLHVKDIVIDEREDKYSLRGYCGLKL